MTLGDYGLIFVGFFLLFGGSLCGFFFAACGIFAKPHSKDNLVMGGIATAYFFLTYLGWNMLSSYWPAIKEAIRNFD